MDQTHVKGTHTNNMDKANNPDHTNRMTQGPGIISDIQTPDTNTNRITQDKPTNKEANGRERDRNSKGTNNISTTNSTKRGRKTNKDSLPDQMDTTDRKTNTNRTEQAISQMTLDQTEVITIIVITSTVTGPTRHRTCKKHTEPTITTQTGTKDPHNTSPKTDKNKHQMLT